MSNGESANVIGCLPFQIQPAASAFIAMWRPCATPPPHPQPLSRVGARGAELSTLSRRQDLSSASFATLIARSTLVILLLLASRVSA